MTCYYCKKNGDLRPYGPRGAMVCFDCAMATPEREAEAEYHFGVQLDAAGSVALIDGSGAGPYPAKHNPEVMERMQQTSLGGDIVAICDEHINSLS